MGSKIAKPHNKLLNDSLNKSREFRSFRNRDSSEDCIKPNQQQSHFSSLATTLTAYSTFATTTTTMAIGNSSTMNKRSQSPGLVVKSGVYYRNREMAKHVHPLQRLAPASSSPVCASPAKVSLPPIGKPLPPAPSLGHMVSLIASKRVGATRKIYFAPPVKVTAVPATAGAPRSSTTKLNAEERLFLDAISSLSQGTHQKTSKATTAAASAPGLKATALAPPPFVFVQKKNDMAARTA